MDKRTDGPVGNGKGEVHCAICGARQGYFDRGEGELLICNKCGRPLSYVVEDDVVIVRSKRKKS